MFAEDTIGEHAAVFQFDFQVFLNEGNGTLVLNWLTLYQIPVTQPPHSLFEQVI